MNESSDQNPQTMKSITAVIVEDEVHSRETLKSFLKEFCPEVELLDMATNVEEGIQKITQLRPQLVFLDIELQTGTGFDVLQKVNHLDFPFRRVQPSGDVRSQTSLKQVRR